AGDIDAEVRRRVAAAQRSDRLDGRPPERGHNSILRHRPARLGHHAPRIAHAAPSRRPQVKARPLRRFYQTLSLRRVGPAVDRYLTVKTLLLRSLSGRRWSGSMLASAIGPAASRMKTWPPDCI